MTTPLTPCEDTGNTALSAVTVTAVPAVPVPAASPAVPSAPARKIRKDSRGHILVGCEKKNRFIPGFLLSTAVLAVISLWYLDLDLSLIHI